MASSQRLTRRRFRWISPSHGGKCLPNGHWLTTQYNLAPSFGIEAERASFEGSMVAQTSPSEARMQRRAHVLEAARALVGIRSEPQFDPVHTDLCAIDVVMVAGSPWLKDGLKRDYGRDQSGYRKLGGGGNTPGKAYFFRSNRNLIHYLKRAGFYIPRGGHPPPVPGMACFLDGQNSGRFNFSPGKNGIILDVRKGRVSRVVMAIPETEDAESDKPTIQVKSILVKSGGYVDRCLIGYADLP
jgi:hypothetical protein